jgi:hypothetical protein
MEQRVLLNTEVIECAEEEGRRRKLNMAEEK